MKITVKVFEHVFDDDPVEEHTFADEQEAVEWLAAQPGHLVLEIEAA
jgi:hypothetical protein